MLCPPPEEERHLSTRAEPTHTRQWHLQHLHVELLRGLPPDRDADGLDARGLTAAAVAATTARRTPESLAGLLVAGRRRRSGEGGTGAASDSVADSAVIARAASGADSLAWTVVSSVPAG